ncbi:MAG: GtrA family protein [Rhizobiales bacterium]|nr:GtrA family protein [Hyphomicrobiales bacterium]
MHAHSDSRTMASEFLRFAAVGFLATAVHYSILIFLIEWIRVPLLLSTSVGFVVGAVVSFTLNRMITFRYQPHFGRGVTKFVLVGFVGLGINALIVASLTQTRLPYIIAQCIATGLVLVWNFTAARTLVFRHASDAV